MTTTYPQTKTLSKDEPIHPIDEMFKDYDPKDCLTLHDIQILRPDAKYPQWDLGDRIPLKRFEGDSRVQDILPTVGTDQMCVVFIDEEGSYQAVFYFNCKK